jgi:hypothetical protein
MGLSVEEDAIFCVNFFVPFGENFWYDELIISSNVVI